MLNSGYKVGATRPVLIQTKGNNWEVQNMPTHAPVVLAGNSPRLPDDTRSRCIRILLMPDIEGTAEDSDWEYIEDEAKQLHDAIATLADSVRDTVANLEVDLPPDCTGRAREKWRPLKRVAIAAGGNWPKIADGLIKRGLAEHKGDREDGLRSESPAMILMRDLHDIWCVPSKSVTSIGRNGQPSAAATSLPSDSGAVQFGHTGASFSEQLCSRVAHARRATYDDDLFPSTFVP